MSNPVPSNPNTFSGNYDSTSVIVTICSALSLYNALELILLIFTTFKEWHGLYFWSLLIASFGVLPYCLGFIVEYFRLTHPWIGKIIDSSGWVMMITGQAVVLYSRLGLILDSRTILKAVKWMIIIDAICFHVTTTVLLFGANYGGRQHTFMLGYTYMEKIQMTGFCIQEFIISGLYVWKTVQLLQVISRKGTRRVMWQLFTINMIIIVMDIGLLAVEYRNLHVLEQSFKSFIYSVKLKLEFAILSKLVELVQSNKLTLSNTLNDTDTYVDASRTTSEFTRIQSTPKRSDPRPRWMEDLEKSNAEHVENLTNGNVNGKEKSSTGHDVDEIEIVQGSPHTLAPLPAATPLSSIDTRRTTKDSDLMYAEILRSISLS